MKIFEPMYQMVMTWAKHKNAPWFLGVMSFAESSFFPIPVDVMLAPMVLAERHKAWVYALIATVTSVLGGIFGYVIGVFFFDTFGQQMLNLLHAHEKFASIQAMFQEYGIWVILLAGFTPIPYKVFTIASGVVGIAIAPFIVMSIVGRGARFFLVSALVYFGGDKIEETLQKRVEMIGWITLILVVLALFAYKYFH